MRTKSLITSTIAASMLLSSAAHAVTYLTPTSSVESISSFFDFGFFGINLINGGQTTAQTNLLTGAQTIYADQFDENRYIFSSTDSTPTVVIKLAAASTNLTNFGATWFNSSFQDRAPTTVSFAVSDDGSIFTPVGSYVWQGTPTDNGGADLVTLASGVSGQYVRYSFTVPGGVANASNAVAISSLSVGSVPEPSTWAMMILGFGTVGFALRNRRKQNVRVTYA